MELVSDRSIRIDIIFKFFGDPILSLSLRIDEEAESGTVGDHDTILNT